MKRRRHSSNVDDDAACEDAAAVLKDEALLRHILTYVGPKEYRFIAGVSHLWKRAYMDTHKGDITTSRDHVFGHRRRIII